MLKRMVIITGCLVFLLAGAHLSQAKDSFSNFQGTIKAFKTYTGAAFATPSGQPNPNVSSQDIYTIELEEYPNKNFIINYNQLIIAGFKEGDNMKGKKVSLKVQKTKPFFADESYKVTVCNRIK
jgi:hypothetical protein